MKPHLNCILVIDDDEPTNFFTNMILEETGCANHISIVQTGQEALEYLAKSESDDPAPAYPSPDLIFLDINMPAMNGWEFLEHYNKLSKSHRAIVIMLNTSLFPEDKIKAREMPEIAGFENKPLTTEKVNAVLEKYFSTAAAK